MQRGMQRWVLRSERAGALVLGNHRGSHRPLVHLRDWREEHTKPPFLVDGLPVGLDIRGRHRCGDPGIRREHNPQGQQASIGSAGLIAKATGLLVLPG